MKESDLYPPVKALLEGLGYSVKAEIGDLDVAGTKGDLLVAVELKTSGSLRLLMQAASRITVSDSVYVAVPASCPTLAKDRRDFVRLLRMLGLGLIEVDVPGRRASVKVDPSEYRPRRRNGDRALLLREHSARAGDPNSGGSDRRRGLMTAYRQRALGIAAFLRDKGPSTAASAKAALGDARAWDVLYGNVYGWFERAGKGLYALSAKGAAEMGRWTAATPGGADPEGGDGCDEIR